MTFRSRSPDLELPPDTAPIRRARSLLLKYEGERLVASNYIAKTSTALTPVGHALLGALDLWQAPAEVFHTVPAAFHHAIPAELRELVAAGAVVRAGTPEGARDLCFERDFLWGDPVAYYHFTIRHTTYMDPVRFSHWMADRVETTPLVPLYRDHASAADAVRLPAPDNTLEGMALIGRRRSYRGFSDEPIRLAEVADCLFAGLGITGFVKGSADEGYLPFSTTPSGGGRNPYEAYVYARNVEGLAPATYHYSAKDHSLVRVTDAENPLPGAVLAGQPWFDNAAALVLLVAYFERTMWKYPHPTGYRVVLLEGGHIAQNIILAATAHGLASTPTCAISDEVAERLIGGSSLTAAAIYSVALGRRSPVPTAVDPLQIIPNRSAPRP